MNKSRILKDWIWFFITWVTLTNEGEEVLSQPVKLGEGYQNFVVYFKVLAGGQKLIVNGELVRSNIYRYYGAQ